MILSEHQNNADLRFKYARALSNPVCLCLFLVAVTLVFYWPVTNYDFLNYDDTDYVTSNPHVYRGLTFNGIVWAFTTSQAAYWHPLTWLSHMLDCQLWGLNAGGHHLTNLLFHAANAVLLFLVLKAMTGALWRSAFVAALFACHPLDVESVAWVAERKSVLSTLFWLLTMGAYLRYVRRPGWRRYVLVVVCYVLGLMSKPMLVTLPFVLLLLDYWPLQRFTTCDFRTLWPLVREKLPLFLLAAISSFVTYLGQHSMGAVTTFAHSPLPVRLAKVSVNYATYLQKMVWPAELAIPYPYALTVSIASAAACAVLAGGITLLVFWQVAARPYLAIGWLWFVGTLVPVIGLVQVGGTPFADRFAYVPLIGLFMILAWGVGGVCASWRVPKPMIIFPAAIILVACGLRTRDQIGYWQNNEPLFRHTLAVTKSNYVAYYNLGNTLLQSGQIDNAIAQYQKALEIQPDIAEVHYNLGVALAQKGRIDNAIAQYQEALEIQPGYADVHYNLGVVFAQKGLSDEAMAHFQRVLEIRPDFSKAHNNLGAVLAQKGLLDEAIFHWRTAIKVDPQNITAQDNLAWVLAAGPTASVRNGAEAVKLARRANQLSGGGNPAILRTLAAAYAESGQFTEAVATARRALQLAATQTNTVLIDALRVQIKLYEAGLPFRDTDRINIPVCPNQPGPSDLGLCRAQPDSALTGIGICGLMD